MVAEVRIEDFLSQIDRNLVQEDNGGCPFSGNFTDEHKLLRQKRIGEYHIVQNKEYYLYNSPFHGYVRVYNRDYKWYWCYFNF
jgi:hypothetical protein